jgi:hypothetical protein
MFARRAGVGNIDVAAHGQDLDLGAGQDGVLDLAL